MSLTSESKTLSDFHLVCIYLHRAESKRFHSFGNDARQKPLGRYGKRHDSR
jgi:hypothetical protein